MLKAGQCVSVLRWYRDWRRISHRQCCGCRMHGGPRERVLSMSRRTASLMVLQSKRARSSVSLSLVSFTHFRLETPPAPLMLISSLATNTMIDPPRFRTLLLCLPRLPLDLWTEPPQCGLADHTWSRCRAAVVPPVLPTQNARGESADHSLKSRC